MKNHTHNSDFSTLSESNGWPQSQNNRLCYAGRKREIRILRQSSTSTSRRPREIKKYISNLVGKICGPGRIGIVLLSDLMSAQNVSDIIQSN